MVIKALTLYNTPYSPDYRNVLNLVSGQTAVYRSSALKQISTARGVTPLDITAISRSAKQIDNTIVVVVPYNALTVYSQYNYAAIIQNPLKTNDRVFAFITSIASQNDGADSPSVAITLQLDAWANNFSSLAVNDYTLCRRTHYSTLVNSAYYDNVLSSSNPPNLFKEQKCLRGLGDVDVDDTPEYPFIPNRFEVLWLRLTLDDWAYLKTSAGSDVNYLYGDQDQYPVLLAPIEVYDRARNQFARDKQFRITFSESATTWYSYSYSIQMVSSLIPKDTHILKAELTYCVPFKVQFTYSNGIYSADVGYYRYDTLKSDKGLFTDFDYVASVNWTVNTPNLYTTSQDLIDVFSPTPLANSEKLVDPISMSVYEEYLQKYPFAYDELRFNGKTQPIINPDGCYHTTVLYYRYRMHPAIQYRYQSTQTLTDYAYSEMIPVTNYGELLVASSAYDAYLRNNGNQLNAKTINSLIQGIALGAAKAYSGNAAGAVSAVGGSVDAIVNSTSKIADLKNVQDSISAPTYNALDFAYQQDLVNVYQVYPLGSEVNKCALDFHYYGCNSPRYGLLVDASRETFNYVQTYDAHLPFITNIRDRMELEAAYNRGITLWHWRETEPDGETLLLIAECNRLASNNRHQT